jgi:hypothetical protein
MLIFDGFTILDFNKEHDQQSWTFILSIQLIMLIIFQ